MDVKINQVILHILDAGASEPVLSDRPMELDADLYEYFSVCIEKAFASDDSKNCRFLPDSPFLQEMQHNDDFIDLSRRIAGVIFEQLLQYQGIPSGDLAVVDCAVDGVPFYAVLKLNYRPGFTHVTNVMGNGQCSTIAPQRTLLPGNSKADEAALIDRANLTIRLIEKKVALDDKKILPVHQGVRLHPGHAGKSQAESRVRNRCGRRAAGLPGAGTAGRCAAL